MLKHQLKLTIIAAIIIMASSATFGDVPKTMNYQGQLLDAEGSPVVDGPYEMTFAIYDDSTTGSPLWEQTFAIVVVEEGLFSVVLGSSGNPIPDSAFAIGQTWLEIFVEGEKIEPRTQLTAMPYTFSAGSVKGDFTTEPGGITLEDAAKGGGFVRLKAHATGNEMSMYAADPTDQDRFTMYDWQGGNPQPMVEMEASPDVGSSIRLADPTDTGDRLALKTDATETSLKMVPPYDPEGLLEIKIDPDSGSVIRMADPPDTGDRLVLSANPVSGSSVCLTDPVYQTDLLALRGTESLGGSFELYNPSFGVPCDPVIWMGVESGPYYSGILRMKEPADQGYNRTLLEISTHVENGATIRMFNPQPEPPEEAALRLDVDALAFLGVDCGGKSTSWRTLYSRCGVAFDDTAGETLKVAKDGDRFPYEAYYMADGLKISNGAADGYVMTSDADGVGTWQPAPGGSMPAGVSQAVEIYGDDTLYSSTTKDIMSQSINCPSSGYVLVMASFDATINHHLGQNSPRFMFGVSNTSGTLDGDQRKEWLIQDYTMEPGTHSCVISTQKIYPVSSGTQTFYVAGYRSNTTSCTDSCWIDNKTLSLVFIPEAYGTVETAATTGYGPDYGEEMSEVLDGGTHSLPDGYAGSKEARIDELESQVQELTSLVNELLEKQR